MSRIEPIERPTNLFTRFAYWMMKRQLGTVMTPAKVVYARMPKSLVLATTEVWVMEKGLSLDPAITHLTRTWVAMINSCSFCVDIGKAVAVQHHMTLEKFDALAEYRTSPLFSDRERAALDYVDEATRNKRVSDTTFDALRRHFDDREIVEITWLNALENYYNLLNLPLGIEADGLCAIAQRRAA
jgi:alkylhydroperoxidase family enzyme